MMVRLDRKQYLSLAVADHRRRMKEKAVEYKGGKCQRCPYDKCIAALEFHHRDPTAKEFRLSSGKSRSWVVIKKELDKCDLVCANCHREIHDEWKAAARAQQREELAAVARNPNVDVKCHICKHPFQVCASRYNSQERFFCSTVCNAKGHEKVEWPSDTQLGILIWQMPMTALSKQLGVSDKAVKKRCARRGIATPGPGYWNKAAA